MILSGVLGLLLITSDESHGANQSDEKKRTIRDQRDGHFSTTGLSEIFETKDVPHRTDELVAAETTHCSLGLSNFRLKKHLALP